MYLVTDLPKHRVGRGDRPGLLEDRYDCVRPYLRRNVSQVDLRPPCQN